MSRADWGAIVAIVFAIVSWVVPFPESLRPLIGALAITVLVFALLGWALSHAGLTTRLQFSKMTVAIVALAGALIAVVAYLSLLKPEPKAASQEVSGIQPTAKDLADLYQRQLALEYAPSLSISPTGNRTDFRLRIMNTGRTDIRLWGLTYGVKAIVAVDVESRIVAPTKAYSVQVHPMFEALVKELPESPNGIAVPFFVFFQTGDDKKYTANCLVTLQGPRNQATFRIQQSGYSPEWTTQSAPRTEPPSPVSKKGNDG